jgi:adenylate cyclase
MSSEQERVDRRLAAILAADVAGYSRLTGKDEEGTLAALKEIRRELADPKIAEHRDRIVKTTGDGLLIEFASVDAVRCAVEIQREMALRNDGVNNERRIEFRIGINLGDVIIDKDDIYGDGVNVAARLEALAKPGGICVTRVARDQVRDKVDFGFEDLGEQQVENSTRPVRVYRIPLAETVRMQAPLALPDKPSLAVLPFQMMPSRTTTSTALSRKSRRGLRPYRGCSSPRAIRVSLTRAYRPIFVKSAGNWAIAEVAVPRQMFTELSLIARLQAPPALA